MNYRNYNIHIIYASLALLLLSLFIEYYSRQVPNVYQHKNAYLESDAYYETLILGSSHAYYGVNPDHFERQAFSGANVSQDLKMDAFILGKSLAHNKKLKSVVLPFSYFSLHYNLESGVESWRKYYYMQNFDYDGFPAEDYLSVVAYSRFLASPKKTNHLQSLVRFHLLNNFEINWSDRGWGTDYTDNLQIPLKASGKIAAERHHSKYVDVIYQENLHLIASMVEACRKAGVQLLVFTPPAFVSYRENLHPQRWIEITESLSKILNDYDRANYVNLLNDDRFMASDYHDADHLNHSGSAKLSKILSDLLVLGFEAQRYGNVR